MEICVLSFQCGLYSDMMQIQIQNEKDLGSLLSYCRDLNSRLLVH